MFVVLIEQIGFSGLVFIHLFRIIGIFLTLMPNAQSIKDQCAQLAIDRLDLLAATATGQATISVHETLSARSAND